MRGLRGKRALVTGAASGIGRALSLRLSAEGMNLSLVDRDYAGLEALRDCIGPSVLVELHVCDLADPRQIDRLAARIGQCADGLDVLINCAGIAYYGRLDRMTDEQLDRVLAVNLYAPIRLTRRLLPLLLAKEESHVLNVASMLGLFAQSKACAYQVSKFGLVGFSESLLAEYARFRLGVTALCPGYVATNLFANGSNQWNEEGVRVPPRWTCTTPEVVADRGVAAISKNRFLVTVGPLAGLLFALKRLSPTLFVRVPTWRKKKRFDGTIGPHPAEARRLAA